MDNINPWMEPIIRWAHVVAGVLWIGLLYFFNWVNGPFGKAIDADTKQKVLPELLPRTLYFFRWGAAYTWITGVLLLALIYYHGKLLTNDPSGAMIALSGSVCVFLIGAAIYDQLWKAMAKSESAGVVVSFVLLVGVMAGMKFGLKLEARALAIHVGALFGTAMAMNVWMRIWPAQRRIIAAIKAGEKPLPADPAMAGLRSKHNTYMSVPLIFIMLNSHATQYIAFEGDKGWLMVAAIVVVGWVITKMIYKKSAGDAPKFY